MTLHWLLLPTGTWHAWPHGAQQSACGLVTISTLAETPAEMLAPRLAPEHLPDACERCVQSTGEEVVETRRGEELVEAVVREWEGYLSRYMKRRHIRLPTAADLRDLAMLLAEVGPPENSGAQEAFELVCKTLLLAPVTIKGERRHRGQKVPTTVQVLPGLHKAIIAMAQESAGMHRVRTALRSWRAIVGNQPAGRFKREQVVDVILSIPDPSAYVKRMNEKSGHTLLGTLFHPNTLKYAQSDPALRGVFAPTGENATTYWDQNADAINYKE